MRQTVELGDVQRTLFFPLAARARETRKKRPLLRDPKAVEIVETVDFELAPIAPGPTALVVTLRTLIMDWWVRRFLAEHPGGTVIELGTGLNTRFERTDNGTAHWIDLDLPDTIELRRRFFADTGRRQMLAASLTDEDWLAAVEQRPAPYFFAPTASSPICAKGRHRHARADRRAVPRRHGRVRHLHHGDVGQEHKMAAKRDVAPWQWACDDPRSLERLGLRLIESVPVTRPPAGLRAELPARYRYLLPLGDPIFGKRGLSLNLFQAG